MPKPKRLASPGKRTRRDNGPALLEILAVPPPTPDQLGQLTKWTEEIIQGGPDALIAATRSAAHTQARYGIDIDPQWLLLTPWLRAVLDSPAHYPSPDQPPNGGSAIPRGSFSGGRRPHNPQNAPISLRPISLLSRAHARVQEVRYTLSWRPTFLAVKALTHSTIIGAKAAGISPQTADNQRKRDPDFDAQCSAAEHYAIQLLHDVTMKSAIEGDLEPVMWQGITVNHIRKYDNRLRVEMLRAHMPKKFITPGRQATLVAGNNNQVMVCDPETIAAIQESHRKSLLAMNDADQPKTDARG